MTPQILYLGDTSLDTAACYLAGCLSYAGWEFDYIPSHQPVSADILQVQHQLYILSDYPAAQFDHDLQSQVVEHVRRGSNLFMIGGWESFHGSGGHWNETPLGDILPVHIGTKDDRRNCDSPVFLKQQADHPITNDLPWSDRVPLIGGYNRVIAKADADIILTAEVHSVFQSNGTFQLYHQRSDPLLVVEEVGQSRRAALMTDLAPHWVGPLVDWGPNRVTACAPRAEPIEVGNFYYQLVLQLISWVGQLTARS